MGCDIHYHAERREGDRWVKVTRQFEKDPKYGWEIDPLENRSYDRFAFLAGVRNYSGVTPISEPRGFPEDASSDVRHDFEGWGSDAHTPSWLTLDELLAFNYDAEMEDRRYTRQEGPGFFNCGATCEPGQGKRQSWRDFLGEHLIGEFRAWKDAGAERLVFWFENQTRRAS